MTEFGGTMDSMDVPAPRRHGVNFGQLLLVVAMVALLGWAQLTAHRPWFIANRPLVAHVADTPGVTEEMLRQRMETNRYVIQNVRYAPPFGRTIIPDLAEARTPPALGYSYREMSMLGMPLFAYTDAGFVLYTEDGRRVKMAPLDPQGRQEIDAIVGRPVAPDYGFPFRDFLWGWSLIAMVAAWIWLWQRSRDREREAAGII
ncbi:hypothetical protein [Sphingomonas immobilis]|uniref:SURF1-like protein n=1 Tax=Sphingomonas immobilis TaxID=3063997 RepID=A0ABT8ZY87_9SPHN|nr:hypothetical protein [Sphingomonas sp. CA1-15]MDO7842531.1 hypothetical protein [Sphingomonas sp. CA1-15]